MITSIQLFKESLSNDSKKEAVQTRLIELQRKIDKLEEDIAATNSKLKNQIEDNGLIQKLEDAKHYSIVFNNILFQIKNAYTSKRFSGSKFNKMFEDSIDKLDPVIVELVNKYKELNATIKPETFSVRKTKLGNKYADTSHGDFGYNESFIGDALHTLLNKFSTWFKSFRNRANDAIDYAQYVLDMVNDDEYNLAISEAVSNNKDGAYQHYLIDEPNIKKYIDRSRYKKHIIETLATTQDCATAMLLGDQYKVSATALVLGELLYANIVTRTKYGRSFKYNLTPNGLNLIEQYMPVSVTPNTNTTIGTNTYTDGNAKIENNFIGEILDFCVEPFKNKLEVLKQTEELKILKEERVKLMKEANIAWFNCDNTIQKLIVTSPQQTVNWSKFVKDITTVENIGDELLDTMKDLLDDFYSDIDVKKSYAFYGDTDFPDGTTDVYFDHEQKKAVKESKINERNTFKRIKMWVSQKIRKFKDLIKRLLPQLESLGA